MRLEDDQLIASGCWLTFAQSKETSVVWGMPSAAVALGAAQAVLSPANIGIRIAAHRADSRVASPLPSHQNSDQLPAPRAITQQRFQNLSPANR
ncbi:MAG: hypothetical protein EXS00_08880 [Phycisphaerales bacterium]|nr:hypothetical protein [Phycisphaerales bacterium]